MRNHDSGYIHWQGAVTEVVGMKNIWSRVANQRAEVVGGVRKILLPLFHPIQPESRWMISKAMQAIHPSGLLGQRNFAEAYERDPQPASDQSGNEFAGIGPIPVERVGRDQNMHRPESPLFYFGCSILRTLFVTSQLLATFVPESA